MHHTQNPAGQGGVDCNATRQSIPYTPKRGENKAPIVGRKFGHWTAVQADTTGKRIHCRCVCGRVRMLGLDQLEAGAISSCGCRPPTIQESKALRAEQARLKAGAP
jgi:hypothetical protein